MTTRKKFEFILNTNRTCFMCYHPIETVIINPSFSLKSICRQLNVNLRGTISIPDKLLPILERLDVQVSLCRGCRILNQKLTKLYREMEMIRMKLEVFLEEMNGKLKGGKRRSELVKQYQKKMEGDKQAMLHSGMVEKLRNEIMLKYSSYSKKSQPRIKIWKRVPKKPIMKTPSEPKISSLLYQSSVKLENLPGSAHPEIDDDSPMAYEMLSVTPDISSFNAEETPSQEERIPTTSSGTFGPSQFRAAFSQQDYYEARPNLGGGPDADANTSQLYSLLTGVYPPPHETQSQASTSTLSNENPKKCKFCLQIFDTLKEKRRHIIQQHQQQRFQCQYCPKSFYDRSTRSRHIKNGNCLGFQAPPKVDISAMRMEAIQRFAANKQAVRLVSSDKQIRSRDKKIRSKETFPCPYCSSSFSTKQGLGNHLTTVHLISKRTRRFACNICQKSFFTGAHLKQHYLGVHVGGQFPCQYCTLKFNTESGLRRHESGGKCRGHPNYVARSSVQVQEGASVSVALAALQSMTMAMAVTTPAAVRKRPIPIAPRPVAVVHPFTCQYCNRIFETEGYLSTHQRQYCEVLRKSSEIDTDGDGATENIRFDEIAFTTTSSGTASVDGFNFSYTEQFGQLVDSEEQQIGRAHV